MKLMSKGKLSDNKLDSGLCVLIYAANLAQFPGPVLTDSGIDNLIQKMIQANRDQSLTTKMRNEITSLILALSEKFSAVHSVETMLVYPSLFDSIEDDSSNSGYSSKHEMSTTNDTYDSAWMLKRKRKSDEMSDESLFYSSKDDSSNSGYSSNHQTSTSNDVTTLKHKRKADAMCGETDFDDTPHESKSGDLNYITTDTLSQESYNDKESYSKGSDEIGYEDNESRGVHHLKGQFTK